MELSGLHGMTVMVYVLCQAHQVTQGKVRVGCDGLSALYQAIDELGDVDPNTKQFDIIAGIREWRSKSPIEWVSNHIRQESLKCIGSSGTLQL
jgi:hypothetical protein